MVISGYLNDAVGELPPNNDRMLKLVTNLLDRGGADYRIVEMRNVKTEFFRTGQMVWNFGTAGAYAEQFDWVVHVNAALGAGGYASTFASYRPDSTLKNGSTKAPTVPQLFLATNAHALINGDNTALLADAASAGACTTGVSGGTVTGAGRGGYLATDPSVRWLNSTYSESFVKNGTSPAGGWRALVGASIPNLEARSPSNRDDDVCRWCDSMVVSASAETVYVFERMMNHITGAKPVVFAMMAGAGLNNDSLYDAGTSTTRPVAEGEVGIALMALARLDSLTSGGVFTRPIKVALTIDGAFSYNARMHPRGILKADSATFDGSMDSLATLSIPATFGVNIDSVAANAEWKRWLAKVPKARFSPQNWTGISDSTANSDGASFLHPVDIMGRYRRRIAFGDSSAAGKDTSLWALLRGGRFKCDSVWPGRSSGFLMAPDDDWSPLGMNGSGTAPGVDSVVFAIARAGFSGVRVNSGDPDHDANYLRSNPKGYYNAQGWYSGSRGTRLKLLAYPGYGRAGAVHNFAHTDSAAPIDSSRFGMIYQDLNRAWVGITQRQDTNYDTWPFDNGPGGGVSRTWDGVWLNQKDRVFPQHYRGSIVRMSANDFSGDPARPTRRGWWVVKSLANEFKAINRLAGRTIIEWAYPEDCLP